MNYKTIEFLLGYTYWKDYEGFRVIDKVQFNYQPDYPEDYVPF